jgi:hypothetical protein
MTKSLVAPSGTLLAKMANMSKKKPAKGKQLKLNKQSVRKLTNDEAQQAQGASGDTCTCPKEGGCSFRAGTKAGAY